MHTHIYIFYLLYYAIKSMQRTSAEYYVLSMRKLLCCSYYDKFVYTNCVINASVYTCTRFAA